MNPLGPRPLADLIRAVLQTDDLGAQRVHHATTNHGIPLRRARLLEIADGAAPLRHELQALAWMGVPLWLAQDIPDEFRGPPSG